MYRNFEKSITDIKVKIAYHTLEIKSLKKQLAIIESQSIQSYKNQIIKSYLDKWINKPDHDYVFEYNQEIIDAVLCLANLEPINDRPDIKIIFNTQEIGIFYFSLIDNDYIEIKPYKKNG